MIVVSNTSPLTSLAAIGEFHLLEILYEQIRIPDEVWNELNAEGVQWPGSLQTSQASWIVRHRVSNQALVTALERDLDRGEAEAIALAVELNADLLLIDEKEGRRAAQRLGLRVTGVIGLLVEAKSQAKISQIRPRLDRLRYDAGFFITDSLYSLALDLAGETDRS
jgi:predicted nucleic acid-binding protein